MQYSNLNQNINQEENYPNEKFKKIVEFTSDNVNISDDNSEKNQSQIIKTTSHENKIIENNDNDSSPTKSIIESIGF